MGAYVVDCMIVCAGNRGSYEKWIREKGMRLKDINFVFAKDIEDFEQVPTDSFYVVLPDFQKNKNSDQIMNQIGNQYVHINRTKLESRLQKGGPYRITR